MKRLTANCDRFPLTGALLAGLAGGVAEIAWVSLYSSVTAVSGIEVARQVAASVFPIADDLALAPALGVVVHLLLSLALVCTFAWALRRPRAQGLSRIAVMCGAVVLLGAVWLFNFFVLLPVLNPKFVTLMPYGATLFSKVLFGVAMASALGAAAAVGGSGGAAPRPAVAAGARYSIAFHGSGDRS